MFDYPDAGHCHEQVYKIAIQCTFDYFELLICCTSIWLENQPTDFSPVFFLRP